MKRAPQGRKAGSLQPFVLLLWRLWRGASVASGISAELGNARLFVTSRAVALLQRGAGLHWLPAGP